MTEGTTYQLITDVCEYSADSTIFQIFFAKNEVLISSAGEPSASTGAQRIQLFDVPICMINRVSAFTRGEARRSEAAQRLLPFQTYLRIFYYRKRRLACAKISSIRRARDRSNIARQRAARKTGRRISRNFAGEKRLAIVSQIFPENLAPVISFSLGGDPANGRSRGNDRRP